MKPAPGPGTATPRERELLERAVELGRRGWGRVHPNPLVGCVLVRDGVLLGEGWHREWGGPHAELEALAAVREAGHTLAGATAVVSLEPCNHQGKTPPCTLALHRAGIARLVYGAADPGAHSGGGGEALRTSGMEVVGPLFDAARARRENPAFFHGMGPRAHRPWVLLKLAVSADGFLAARAGERTPISGAEAQARVHLLRAGVDAVLVGGRTAAVDDPLLTPRGAVVPRVPPRRVVLDAGGELPPTARILHQGDGEVLVVRPPGASLEAPSARGRVVQVETAPLAAPGRFDLDQVLRALRDQGTRSLLCEGGGVLASALLQEDLVDRFVLVASERPVGSGGVPAFPGLGSGWRPGAPPPLHAWSAVGEPEALGSDTWATWDRERT
jgi:diaminohydroxyphosphoribosylaminopyrimidine deaminase / 5-amino-6-(5-phosphoribosylamino)uracil reductase